MAAGFGGGGIVAGSVASFSQSVAGNIATGSMFATLQSAGTIAAVTKTAATFTVGGDHGSSGFQWKVSREGAWFQLELGKRVLHFLCPFPAGGNVRCFC